MTPVYKFSASSFKNGRTVYGSMLAGNSAYEEPSDFLSIASVTLTSSSSAINFTSIPNTYKHLHIRGLIRGTNNEPASGDISLRINDDSGSNYSQHSLYAEVPNTGAAAAYYKNASLNPYWPQCAYGTGATANGNLFTPFYINIWDYASDKKKTMNGFQCTFYDFNSTKNTFISNPSCVWNSTAAITSLEFSISYAGGLAFAANTKMSLYGIKG